MDTDDYWLWEIWLLTISYRCIFNISESPENWRSRAHLAKTYLVFRTQGAEERWHTLPWTGFWSLGVYFLSPVLFPWSLTLASVMLPWQYDAPQAIWSRHCERKRIAQAWLQKMVILHDSLTVLRHRVFNPLSAFQGYFVGGTTQIKKEHLIEGHHCLPHGEPWRVF